jgi:hypothetical protein
VVSLASGGKAAAISVNDVSEAFAVCVEVEATATSADGAETKKKRESSEARVKKNIVVLLL